MRLSDQARDKVLFLAAMTAHQELFEKFRVRVRVNSLDNKSLIYLLDEAPETIVLNRSLTAIVEDLDDWNDGKVITLLKRCPSLAVEEGGLEAAIGRASLEVFSLLVARATRALLEHERTKDVLACAAQNLSPDLVLEEFINSTLSHDYRYFPKDLQIRMIV